MNKKKIQPNNETNQQTTNNIDKKPRAVTQEKQIDIRQWNPSTFLAASSDQNYLQSEKYSSFLPLYFGNKD